MAQKDFKLKRKVADELELLGFSLSAHPLELYELKGCAESRQMPKLIGKKVWLAGWLIAAKIIPARKAKGEAKGVRKERGEMRFLSLEDLSGAYEATLFPPAYRRFARLACGHGPFRLQGRVEDDQGALSLNVERLEELPLKPDSKPQE
jgi:DNA polymerase III alpha subunit